jgi:hypothetical protein
MTCLDRKVWGWMIEMRYSQRERAEKGSQQTVTFRDDQDKKYLHRFIICMFYCKVKLSMLKVKGS